MDAGESIRASAFIRGLAMTDPRKSYDPFNNLPDMVSLNNCPQCGERIEYEKMSTGLITFHVVNQSFLCPEPRSRS